MGVATAMTAEEYVRNIPQRFWDDEKWAYEHYARLRQQFPNQWVIVYNRQVVGAARSLEDAEMMAEGRYGRYPMILFVEKGRHVY